MVRFRNMTGIEFISNCDATELNSNANDKQKQFIAVVVAWTMKKIIIQMHFLFLRKAEPVSKWLIIRGATTTTKQWYMRISSVPIKMELINS